MKAQQISDAIDLIKVDTIGRRQGMGKAISKIQSEHLKSVDGVLMDVRVYVAKLSGYSAEGLKKMIDQFIYEKQIS